MSPARKRDRMCDAIFRPGSWNDPDSMFEVELRDGCTANFTNPLAGEKRQAQHATCAWGNIQAVQAGPETPNFVMRQRSIAALFGIELKACGRIHLHPALSNAPAVYAANQLDVPVGFDGRA